MLRESNGHKGIAIRLDLVFSSLPKEKYQSQNTNFKLYANQVLCHDKWISNCIIVFLIFYSFPLYYLNAMDKQRLDISLCDQVEKWLTKEKIK